jgi:spermidine synthase
MEPWTEISRARTAAGDELVLRERSGVYEIRCNGWDLMSNRAHASEETMARLVLAEIAGRPTPRILIGGLGMGFTLRAALDAAPADARIEVAELVPEIVAWNRGPLATLASRPLDDSRASVRVADVAAVLRGVEACWDAILLDTDNGPGAIMLAANARLYAREGVAQALRALALGGVLALWAADRSASFEADLVAMGLDWREVETPAAPGRAPDHTVYLLRKPT